MRNPSRRKLLKLAWCAAGAIGAGALIRGMKAWTPLRLRPPGAGTEADFLAACIRCGQCVEACPPQVLTLGDADSLAGLGAPYFVPRDRPCDLCQGRDDLQCIAVCPTAALQGVARRRDVRIGVARIDKEICLPWRGVACKACWHACPFPNEAIEIDERGRAVVNEGSCVGCGLCERACLTEYPAMGFGRL